METLKDKIEEQINTARTNLNKKNEKKLVQLQSQLDKVNTNISGIKNNIQDPRLRTILQRKDELNNLINTRDQNLGSTEFANLNSNREINKPTVKTSLYQTNIISSQTNLGDKNKKYSKETIDALSNCKDLSNKIKNHPNNSCDTIVVGYRLYPNKMNIEGYYKQPNGTYKRFDYHVKIDEKYQNDIKPVFKNAQNKDITQTEYNNNLLNRKHTKE